MGSELFLSPAGLVSIGYQEALSSAKHSIRNVRSLKNYLLRISFGLENGKIKEKMLSVTLSRSQSGDGGKCVGRAFTLIQKCIGVSNRHRNLPPHPPWSG